MKKTVKIFRWSESRNKGEFLNSTFNPDFKATFASIEAKRIKAENRRKTQINWSFV